MQDPVRAFYKLLTSPTAIFSVVAGFSVLALVMALAAEAVFGLEPCKLCIYQRIPFVITALIGFLGLRARNKPSVIRPLLILCGLAFLTNAGIAFYHSGVELHWWRSAVEGCVVNFGNTASQSMLENILSAPTGRCDEIPWSDPLLGLSMANYNVLFCFALFVLCLFGLYKTKDT